MKKFNKEIKVAVIFILLVIAYLPTFIWMKARFQEADSYYGHGFLVPFIFFWLIFRKKDKLKKLKIKSEPLGLFILIFALLLHIFLGLYFQIKFISGFSLLITLLGIFLYLGGKEITKELLFPIIFLIFMVPLPKVLIIHISFSMKLLAAKVATSFINWLNIPAIRNGGVIQLPNAIITVGAPCSGLRSLIALTGLGALFSYLVDLSLKKKAILFISSVPLALAANILRITGILWVAYVYGYEAAMGKFHDVSGMFTFVFAFLGLITVNKVLQWKIRK